MSARSLFLKFIKIGLYIAIFMAAAGMGTYFSVRLLIPGKNSVVVPDLMGKDVVYALEMLTDLGLNTKVKAFRYSDSTPKHHIIDQAPEAGTEIKIGRDVRIVISKGPQEVIYPGLIGMNLPMAVILLEENDLRQGNLSYTYNTQRPREEVLAQSPAAGVTGRRESAMDLLISAGPRPWRLRLNDLRDLRLEHAIETLEKEHLTLGAITQVHLPDRPDGIVVDHSPQPGYPVQSGTAVDLVVNRQVQSAAGALRQAGTLFRHRVPQGFLRQHVRVRIIRSDGALEIYNDFAGPGEEIWLLILRDRPTALFLYLDGELSMTKNYE